MSDIAPAPTWRHPSPEMAPLFIGNALHTARQAIAFAVATDLGLGLGLIGEYERAHLVDIHTELGRLDAYLADGTDLDG